MQSISTFAAFGSPPCQFTVNGTALVAVPPGVLTEISPVFAPFGTVAVICVAELTTNGALLPANINLVAPVKLVPVRVTAVPIGPLCGVNPVIVGAERSVKLPEVVAIPPGVVTEIGPVVAPAGTVAISFVPLSLKLATLPLKLTKVALFRFEPVMVTDVPTPPLPGENPVIDGGRFATTVNVDALVAVPPLVVTAIEPLVAPDGTVAVI